MNFKALKSGRVDSNRPDNFERPSDSNLRFGLARVVRPDPIQIRLHLQDLSHDEERRRSSGRCRSTAARRPVHARHLRG